MTKEAMKEFAIELETCLERALKLWKKSSYIENGEVVQFAWQFEQTHLVIDVFWKDGDERIKLYMTHPRRRYQYEWSGLTPESLDKVLDRVGNIGQTMMYRTPYE